MSMRPNTRPTSQRGLLAGLLALVVFASAAVALTARGPAPAATAGSPRVPADQTAFGAPAGAAAALVEAPEDVVAPPVQAAGMDAPRTADRIAGAGRVRDGGARVVVQGDGDGGRRGTPGRRGPGR